MFEPMFMRLALVAAIATGAPLAVMGVYLVIRRVVFIGLVLANTAAMGAAIAQVFGWSPELASVAVTVAGALALGIVPTPRRVPAESVMGWAYATVSSATVLILSRAAAADADTLHLLFGNLLAVSVNHLIVLVIVAVGIAVVQFLFGKRFLLVTFDPEAAQVAGVRTKSWSLGLNLSIGIVAAAAVHEIGSLLTFSFLTLPAMAALLVTTSIRATFILATALGVVLGCLGLAVSFYFDLPAGPAVVAVLAGGVLAVAVFRWLVRQKSSLVDSAAPRQTAQIAGREAKSKP